jgi:heme A synthase
VALAYELAGRWPLPARWHIPGQPALVGSVGYYDQQQLFGASYMASGTGLRFTHRHLELELMHYLADHAASRLYEE